MSDVYDPRPSLHLMLAIIVGDDEKIEAVQRDTDAPQMVQSLGSLFVLFGVQAAGAVGFRDWLNQLALDQDVDPITEGETDE